MPKDLARNRAVWHSSAADYSHTGHLVTNTVDLPWISRGNEAEWLLLDLGKSAEISSLSIRFGSDCAENIRIEVSEDEKTWHLVTEGNGERDAAVEFTFSARARFVKLLFSGCSGAQVIVYRVCVFGEGDLEDVLPPLPAPDPDGTQKLSGGTWRVERASEVPSDVSVLSEASYDDSSWLPAIVPGTVLNSYVQAGAVPDPFYDDDQFQVSEEFFTADFWYRDRFEIPEDRKGRRIFLNFQEINWKADVYLNGTFLQNEDPERAHSIEGEFIRAKFDITELVQFGQENILLVRILQNETPGLVTTQGLAYGPGPNGGLLGADNPTCHASVGWDWLPTIRGRNIGILGEVSLRFSGDVILEDPWMETGLSLLSDSTAIPTEDLMERDGVRITDGPDLRTQQWHGRTGDCLTVDFGAPVPIGAVTMIWGAVENGPAADLQSRHPDAFSLTVSDDGEHFRNLDAYAGGTVDVRWFGKKSAEPQAGTSEYPGHAISDTCPGATAIIPLDFSRFGRGIENHNFVQPEKVRYLRFTVLRARELNAYPVETIVSAIHVYSESPEAVEQATRHHYTLDTTKAELVFRTEIRNCSAAEKSVTLQGRILPDGPEFRKEILLPGAERSELQIPVTLPAPRLWWPNTYGAQPLYTCEVTLSENAVTSDRKVFRFGVRRFDTPIEGGLLTLYCNGVRIVCRGGNWGLDDGMKKDTREVLFDKVRLHKEANMTMIRNWVGMTSHPAFYEACDEYGILIWDDFWLANPADGPAPNDPAMFLRNAADRIRATRSHAALAFYCGRNEGNPPEEINAGLAKITRALDGTRIYFPHSASAPVGSGGGYSLAKPGPDFGVKQYFNDITSSVLRSERGIPNVPEIESAKKFVRPEHLWPISETWALHDWTYHMNGPANTFMEAAKMILGGDFEVAVDRVRGQSPQDSDPVFAEYKTAVAKMVKEAAEAWTCEDFFQAAQLLNYDHHRGLFEALSARLSNGLLMWMSQSSWPSFMWQTYDYYLYCNGGFFGAKAGNQPVKAFLDPRNDRILLANATAESFENVTVTETFYNLYGKLLEKRDIPVETLPSDAYGLSVWALDFSCSDTDLVFLRLSLRDAAGKLLSENIYWHNRKDYQDYRALREIGSTAFRLRLLSEDEITAAPDNRPMTRMQFEITNGSLPALNVRLRLLDAQGADILPVFFSDNYLLMMPGETRIITAEFDRRRYPGTPAFTVGAWNQEQ